ncbi:hypothetical protein Pla175_22310 [Pirellulimonas nuda]|uniref:Uncharacterized protein n=1 Tax=Pirellulimonas nuda TaxID=2528009 RepID=A0A518DBJ0_9BACT|nr:hypothetical protein [Pirellulimonas nuda]QDU88847.1 hypothetical protein Pla175_22310 [Pirellulimonas nuda]
MDRSQKSRRTAATLVCAGALLAPLAGCGGGPFDIVPVSGVVKYDDGSAIPSDDFRLKFVPQMESPDGVNFPRVATAMVNASGDFDQATTHKYGDGLVRGRHKVYLKIGQGPGGKPLVPADYLDAEKTPLTIDTAEGRRFEISVPKP